MALGTATITATAYNGLTASCAVTVAQPVETIALALKEKGDAVVYKGGTVSVAATVSPSNAGDTGVAWISSSNKIATVDANGVVTGRAAGRVSITAMAKDGSRVSKSIPLTVAAPEKAIILNKTSAVIYWNGGTDALGTVQLAAVASPGGARYRWVAWTSGDKSVATVDRESGLVTAVAGGTAVIRAITDNGHFAYCTVTVRTLPDAVSLNTTTKPLAFKQSYNLAADAILTGGNEPALTWRSDNPKVATVSATGVVKASKNKAGTAHITVTTKNGKTATCTITVVRKLP